MSDAYGEPLISCPVEVAVLLHPRKAFRIEMSSRIVGMLKAAGAVHQQVCPGPLAGFARHDCIASPDQPNALGGRTPKQRRDGETVERANPTDSSRLPPRQTPSARGERLSDPKFRRCW